MFPQKNLLWFNDGKKLLLSYLINIYLENSWMELFCFTYQFKKAMHQTYKLKRLHGLKSKELPSEYYNEPTEQFNLSVKYLSIKIVLLYFWGELREETEKKRENLSF